MIDNIVISVYVLGVIAFIFASGIKEEKYDTAPGFVYIIFSPLWPIIAPIVMLEWGRKKFGITARKWIKKREEKKKEREKQYLINEEENAKMDALAKQLGINEPSAKVYPDYYPPTPQAPMKQLSAGGYRTMECKECGNKVEKEAGKANNEKDISF